MANNEKDFIVEYALQSERNLEVALKVYYSFDEIRKRIILGFLEELENALRKSLDDQWKIMNHLKENVFDHWKGIFITKNQWKEKQYGIGISSEKYGARGFIIGVTKIEKSQPIAEGRLKNLIDQQYKPGSTSDSWDWYQGVEGIYQNWDNEEILIKMNKKTEAVSYFKDHILRIKEIAEPVIDEAVKTI